MNKIGKILFVDDDDISLFLNQLLVEQLGVADQVNTFINSEEALQYIVDHYSVYASKQEGIPDLIFLDVKMPGLDGFELLTELEKLSNIDRSRFLIVILTASMHSRDKQHAVAYNDYIYEYLIKPLATENITSLVSKIRAKADH